MYTAFMVMRRKRFRGCCICGGAAPVSPTSRRVRKGAAGCFPVFPVIRTVFSVQATGWAGSLNE